MAGRVRWAPLVVTVAALAAAGLLVAGVLVWRSPPQGAALDRLPGPDPGMGQVHGLVVDPGDGSVWVAARQGVFRLDDTGRARRVANRYQETHGLAVTGPGRLLASGHPDPREQWPDKLGLIESTDGARTWRELSLAGLADFHHLVVRHGRVYGYDAASRRLMTSRDRRNWRDLATVRLDDIAVSPDDPALLLTISNGRLLRSGDGGRTFSPVGRRDLAVLAWPEPDVLFSMTAGGELLGSRDGGKTWRRLGRVEGVPAAMAAADVDRLWVATDTGIYASTDGGEDFDLAYRD